VRLVPISNNWPLQAVVSISNNWLLACHVLAVVNLCMMGWERDSCSCTIVATKVRGLARCSPLSGSSSCQIIWRNSILSHQYAKYYHVIKTHLLIEDFLLVLSWCLDFGILLDIIIMKKNDQNTLAWTSRLPHATFSRIDLIVTDKHGITFTHYW
jgi:hypothetical protein